MEIHIPSLLIVLVGAVAAPLISEATRRIGLSVVVLELLLGVANGLMKASEAAPLIGGAMLTVILFPIIAMKLAGQSASQATAHLDDRDGL